MEDGLDEVDVRQVDAAPAVRVVEDEHVARLEAFAVRGDHVADRRRERPEVKGDAQPLRDQLAAGVEDPGRVVERVADRRRVGGPGDDQGHLVGHRAQRVADDLERRRSRVRPVRAAHGAVAGQATCSMTIVCCVVEPGRPAGRDDRRRVELLDQRRARRSASADVRAADDGHRRAAQPRPEPGRPGRRPAARRRRSAARQRAVARQRGRSRGR